MLPDRDNRTLASTSLSWLTDSPILSLRDVTWAYADGRRVLDVPCLDIERGRLVMIVGPSGCGKTTLLEMLGLMNHPVGGRSKITFFPDRDGPGVDYATLWQDSSRLTEVRSRHFAFVFQQTRMLSPFFVDENIGLTQMIREHVTAGEAITVARSWMRSIHIGDKSGPVQPDRLSGGELQRAAFARAVSSDYRILFGDEPTGNLGENEARCVLDAIRDDIRREPGQRTAIIVTHNIDLALEYADQLIVLPGQGPVHHSFEPVRIHDTNTWPDFDRKTLLDTIYANGKSISTPPQIPYDARKFERFLGDRMGTVLFSFRDVRTWLFALALLLGLLSIGIMRGGIHYLEAKLQNPFLRSVEIELSETQKDEVETYRQVFLTPEVSERYAIDTVTAYNTFYLKIASDRASVDIKTRTIDFGDPILHLIGSTTNRVEGSTFTGLHDTAVLVTSRFLAENGYPPSTGFLRWDFFNDGQYLMNLPIRGIFRTLPGNYELIVTPYFYQQYLKIGDNPFHPQNARNDLLLYHEGDETVMESLIDSLHAYFTENHAPQVNLLHIAAPMPYTQSHRTGHFTALVFEPSLAWREKETLFREIIRSHHLRGFTTVHLLEPVFNEEETDVDFYHLSVFFNPMGTWSSLQALSAFQTYADDSFDLHIGMGQIESLRNVSFITLLVQVLSQIGILAVVLVIALFLYFALHLHLFKMRASIGQLMAFGASNDQIRRAYVRSFARHYLIFAGLAFCSAILIGGLYETVLNVVLEPDRDYFDLWNPVAVVFLLFAFLIGLATLVYTIRDLLKRAPGDLIYERD